MGVKIRFIIGGVMDIEECKRKAANVGELLSGGMVVDADTLPDDWDALADILADYARHAASCASRLAAYAGIARREANRKGA